MYRVKLTARAQKELDKIPGEDSERIVSALQGLGDNPRRRGVRKLRNTMYRIRVGNWRIIYAIFDKDKLVLVGKTARREEKNRIGTGR